MQEVELSYNIKKAFCVQMGDEAGHEISELLQALISRVQQLEKTKVDIMPIVPVRPSVGPTTLRKAA